MEAGRARGGGRGKQRERGGRGQRGHARTIISDDIRATLVDYVIKNGLTLREAGKRVHPNVSPFTVSSIIRTFRQENRYVFNSLLRLSTVLYHITLPFHMFCIAGWLMLSNKSGSFVKHTVITC